MTIQPHTPLHTCLQGSWWTRFLVPKQLTFPSVLTKQSGVVPGRIDRTHHLLLLSLEGSELQLNPGEISVN